MIKARMITPILAYRVRYILCLILLLGLVPRRATAATNYIVSLANPKQHLVEVQIMLPEGSAQRELQLPVWNALYQVRDFDAVRQLGAGKRSCGPRARRARIG